jgi:hypothetical protein
MSNKDKKTDKIYYCIEKFYSYKDNYHEQLHFTNWDAKSCVENTVRGRLNENEYADLLLGEWLPYRFRTDYRSNEDVVFNLFTEQTEIKPDEIITVLIAKSTDYENMSMEKLQSSIPIIINGAVSFKVSKELRINKDIFFSTDLLLLSKIN